jgi:hypothetical protein
MMAKQVSFYDCNLDELFIRVQINRPLFFADYVGFKNWLEARVAWLSDSDRPGKFSVASELNTAHFWFSDPNVAFEFKMRWA